MEELFNQTNLKSFITFLHLVGLALGVGGTWILDVFIIQHLRSSVVTRDKYHLIEFISGLVMTGLLLLWLSGFLFILFYYLFTPDNLYNQKVWAKTFIVCVLTLNGYFVHRYVMPLLKQSTGKFLTQSLSPGDIRKLTVIGTVSFISWLYPIILGVSKSLNFTVPGMYIVASYLLVLLISLVISNLLASLVFNDRSYRVYMDISSSKR